MLKKRGARKESKNYLKKLPGILWFILGIVITLWTVLWLLVSLNPYSNFASITSVVLFGIGFYSMCVFIVGTILFYLIKFIRRLNKKPKKVAKVKKAPVKKAIKKKSRKKKKKL